MESVFVAMCVHRDLRAKIFNLARTLERTKDINIEFNILDGDALIDRSRSRIATFFLEQKKESDIILFLDDDIVYEPETIFKQIRLIRENNLDIVGATYATKDQYKKPGLTFKGLNNVDKYVMGKDGAVVEVQYISTGCMAIKRNVLEKMSQSDMVHLCYPETYRFYPFFMPMEHKTEAGIWTYLSEDWAFCQRARDLGFKVHLDCSSKLEHIGDYNYDWNDILREPKKVNDQLILNVNVTKE